MITTQALSTRLTQLSDANKQTVQLIQRLAKLQFQPGSTPLDAQDEGDVRVELGSEIHEGLKQQDEELEFLRQEVEELTASSVKRKDNSEREREKSRLNIQIARLGEDLKHARSHFRRAQLSAKKNAEAAKQKERELLFAGIQEGNSTPTSSSRARRRQDKELTQDEIVGQASSDVTLALRRTHQLMTSELSRSRFAQETLDQSTAALADLGERYTDLNTLLASSKTLLSSLLRSQKSDTWYLETTFYILLTTIAWLLYRRFLYGPLWWFLWLPLKLAYRALFAVLAAIGLSGGAGSAGGASLSVPSLAATQSPTSHLITSSSSSSSTASQQQQSSIEGDDPSPTASLSQQVGQMAEQDQQRAQEAHKGEVEGVVEEEAVAIDGVERERGEDAQTRGDGVPLSKSDKPRNAKKRMWEEDVEGARYEQQRQQQQEQKQQRRERDEL
ncbi:uncharacterized protein K452DRAFT_318753 [Aplosporella prunicola CBS 121167]|uniref:Sec20 C-terminal domain-containing protein n=1 Tax=Aplosporella prunicola CBS 121167 TaxID=1176127 RepID=A0A6A6BEJ5_9PEZI|nr:uncharacterized protein K452DRAFT_318753 [Aplosporella prunicola CBS 121167]KAF2141813.1 hypothetical protein K452DRAFT_318753 [Aplosporella prunicola CBS 121167]